MHGVVLIRSSLGIEPYRTRLFAPRTYRRNVFLNGGVHDSFNGAHIRSPCSGSRPACGFRVDVVVKDHYKYIIYQLYRYVNSNRYCVRIYGGLGV